jgi:hypothetical protein
MTWRFLVLIALVSTVFLGKETSVRAETVDRYGSLEKISPKLAQSLSAKDYFNRGLAKHVLGDNEGAIADYKERSPTSTKPSASILILLKLT